MEDTLHIAGAEGRPGNPVGCRAPGGAIWVFAGAEYRPTFLLALRRRSPEGPALRGLLREMPRHTRELIVARYDDRDPFAVSDWDDDDLQDHLEWMAEGARLKLYRLDADEAFRLKDVEDPLFQHPDIPDALPGNAAPAVLLRQRRLQLAEELGGQLIRRWMSKDAADGVFWAASGWRGDLERVLITAGGMMHAAGDGVVAFVRGTGELFEALWRIGKVVVTATGDAVRFTAEFVDKLSEGEIAEAAAQLNRIGIRIRNGLDDIKRRVADGIKWLNLLNEDAQSRRILANYFVGLKGSISDVDRATLPVRVVTEFGLEVILTIAVGVVTGGVGAAVNVARRIGQFAGRAIELIIDIIKLLRKAAADTAERAAGAIARPRRSTPDAEPPEIGDPRLRAARRAKSRRGPHNQHWDRIRVEDFNPDGSVDMNALSPSEEMAKETLLDQGWKANKIKQVLETGGDFETKSLAPGDRVYGFNTAGRGKDLNTSAYWLDEAAYRELEEKFLGPEGWDREGVKDYLALPCFNRANAIDVAEITESTTVVEARIGKATELVEYANNDGFTTGLRTKTMQGGGRQITVAPSALQLATGP